MTAMNIASPHDDYTRVLAALLDEAGVAIGGAKPWDLQVHHPDTARRLLARGSLGLGESYVDGWWDCERLDEFIFRVLEARLHDKVRTPALLLHGLKARMINLQSERRAWHVARVHYDLGSDFFAAMLDPTLAYSCGYWAGSDSLEAAQEAKLEMICRKLGLRPGMRLLDIGCGWGSLMRFAALHYGVACDGLTVSRAQYDYGRECCAGLPVTFHLCDYRQFDGAEAGSFDRIASVGMFEHVGKKNYRTFFAMARRFLSGDGLFLLHTIGSNRRGVGVDPWIERYIFPNGALPSVGELADAAEASFIVEDWHNFGADYDRTLMAWLERFEQGWARFSERYGQRFRRMWRYYLMACAGSFRARDNQLWQVVLSPAGVPGGYRRPA